MGDIVLWNQSGGWEQMDGAQGLTRPSKFFDAQRAVQNNINQLHSCSNSIINITEYISQKRAEIGGLRAGIEAKDFTEADVADDIVRLNDNIKVLQDNLEQQKKDLKQCEDDVSVLEAALQEATDEYESVKGDEDALKTWIESNQ
jgi:chromosome segregation ATPase